MWAVFALLSAVFAALTSILAKVGINGVNSNLATALRTIVVLIMAWGMVFITGSQKGLSGISNKSWLFFDFVGPCDRSFMAVLLPGSSARRRVEGGSDRQTQRSDYSDTCVCFSS